MTQAPPVRSHPFLWNCSKFHCLCLRDQPHSSSALDVPGHHCLHLAKLAPMAYWIVTDGDLWLVCSTSVGKKVTPLETSMSKNLSPISELPAASLSGAAKRGQGAMCAIRKFLTRKFLTMRRPASSENCHRHILRPGSVLNSLNRLKNCGVDLQIILRDSSKYVSHQPSQKKQVQSTSVRICPQYTCRCVVWKPLTISRCPELAISPSDIGLGTALGTTPTGRRSLLKGCEPAGEFGSVWKWGDP